MSALEVRAPAAPIWLAFGDAERGEDLAWLEGLGALLFALAALLSAHSLARTGRPRAASASPASTGLRMRRRLMVWLLAANLLRGLSLAAEFALRESAPSGLLAHWEPAQRRWLEDLVSLLPALVFLSAFSMLVVFWAQLHYTTTIVPLPLLDCLFVSVNLACYVLVAAIAVCTFLLRFYAHLWTYVACIVGFLDSVVALSFFYYGLMVVLELRVTSRKRSPGRHLTERVAALLVVCPAALLLRGGCYLAWGISPGRYSQLTNLLLYLSGEWLPSLAALAVLNPLQRGGAAASLDALNDSTDSEPLMPEDATPPPRSITGVPGVEWKQLYPPPAPV